MDNAVSVRGLRELATPKVGEPHYAKGVIVMCSGRCDRICFQNMTIHPKAVVVRLAGASLARHRERIGPVLPQSV
jgi:hypothetical protein